MRSSGGVRSGIGGGCFGDMDSNNDLKKMLPKDQPIGYNSNRKLVS